MMNRDKNNVHEMIPRFLKQWKVTRRPCEILVVLAAGTCGLLAEMVFMFWFQPSSGTLAEYVHSRSFRVSAIPKNLSGITYHPASKTLFLISNTPARVYEISAEGRLLRQIDLVGFYDTEAIVFIEKHTFAVIEERRRSITVFQIFPQTRKIPYAHCRHIAVLPPTKANTGLEGLAWDPESRNFLVAQQKNPRAVYRIPYDSKGGALEVPALHNLPWVKLASYSDLYYARDSRRLLILSRTSGKLTDYSLEGKEEGSLNLFRFIPGVIRTEGLTVVPGGELYICSEPDRVDVFKKPPDKKEM